MYIIGSEMEIENAVSNLLNEQFGCRHECKSTYSIVRIGTIKYNIYIMMVYKVTRTLIRSTELLYCIRDIGRGFICHGPLIASGTIGGGGTRRCCHVLLVVASSN